MSKDKAPKSGPLGGKSGRGKPVADGWDPPRGSDTTKRKATDPDVEGHPLGKGEGRKR